MKKKKVVFLCSAVFYLGMFVMAVSARKIHEATLPRVTICMLDYVTFIERQEDSKTLHTTGLGLAKELYDGKQVYVVQQQMVNGEERSIARDVTNDLVLGKETEDYYEVLEGISGMAMVVTATEKPLWNGCEVYVK